MARIDKIHTVLIMHINSIIKIVVYHKNMGCTKRGVLPKGGVASISVIQKMACLNIEDISTVRDKALPARDKWFDLGISLKVDTGIH